MIKNLRVQNFKSIENLEIEPTKFNILIGSPNVGKSNILEALGLFSSFFYWSNAKDRSLISKDFARYEYILNLFHNYDITKPIEIQTDARKIVINAEEDVFKYAFKQIELGIKCNNEGKMYRDVISSKELFRHELDRTGQSVGGDNVRDSNKKLKTDVASKIKFYRKLEIKEYKSTDFSFLKPPSGNNLLTILQTNQKLYNLLNNLLTPYKLEIMPREFENKIEFLKKTKGKLLPIPFSLLAETFHQLFLIICAIETNKDSVILFEEPETHIFPKYTKYIAELVAKDNNNNQYFITTHNPYFLLSLIEKSAKDELSIFAVDLKDDTTNVKKLKPKEITMILEGENPFFNIKKYFE